MVYSIFNPGGFWFESQVKMLWRIKAWMRAWMKLRHLTSRLRKITKHKSNLQSSVFCLNQTKLPHSTGNEFSMVNPGGFWFEAQVKMLWRKKAWMQAWMCLRHLTSSLRKITKHKSHLQSSIFLLESNQNYTFNWKRVFLWSIQVDFDLKHK